MDKHHLDWMKGGPCYNTSISLKIHRKMFKGVIINARTNRYNIMCYIDVHEKSIHQNMMMESVVVVIHYHQI